MPLNFGGFFSGLFKQSNKDEIGIGAIKEEEIPSAITVNFQETQMPTAPSWEDIDGATITINVRANRKTLIMWTTKVDTDTNGEGIIIRTLRNGSQIGESRRFEIDGGTGTGTMAYIYLDEPGEGEFIYKLQGRSGDGTADVLDGHMVIQTILI
jgi:hypothetical protein